VERERNGPTPVWAGHVWAALQGAAAATVAWALARQVGGDHDPFFAPIAAFVALNAPLGERGLNAVRLLVGVFVGIGVGEVTILLLGGGYGALAMATFLAVLGARALGGSRITIAQAAVAAILVVALAGGDAGIYRMADALIGAGVALVFSQALFSPEPVRLLRRAEAAALVDLADGLELAARALDHEDDELAERALSRLRAMRDGLAELNRVRGASRRVARRSVVWRSQRAPVVRETENAGHLDLLAGSSLLFVRAAVAASVTVRRWLAPSVHELVSVLGDLARELDDRTARQRAADRALEVARRLGRADPQTDTTLLVVVATGRIMAADLMAFAGVEAEQAVAAVQEGVGAFDVPTPPPAPQAPFGVGPDSSRRDHRRTPFRAAAASLLRRLSR
jgi:hypothetical protein